MRILLTGFGPFPGVDANPSARVVEELRTAYACGAEVKLALSGAPIDLCTEVLPVAYAEAGELVRRRIADVRPDIVLMLGVAPRSDRIALERVALNLDDTPDRADNTGDAPDGRAIEPDGPLAYASTLPLLSLRNRLRAEGVAVTISNHAGAYLCNHVFYVARHAAEQIYPAPRCGFIHLPMPRELQPDGPGSAFSTADLTAAIRRCIEILAETG
jgi:pyroglutamyl-peptidase